MRSLLILAFVANGLFYPGCTMTAGFYVDKQWHTDPSVYTQPDMNTRFKIEVTKDFSDVGHN